MRGLPPTLQSPFDRAVWELDRKINETGVPVDVELCKYAMALYDEEVKKDKEVLKLITGLDNPVSNSQFGTWIRGKFPDAPDVRQDTLRSLMEQTSDELVKKAIRLKLGVARTPLKKYQKLIDTTCKDGRVKNSLIIYAAATGRWAGSIINMQNMPRPDKAIEGIENEIVNTLLQIGYLPDYIVSDKIGALSSCIRSAICAPEGHQLTSVDFSAVEARGLAWLAGQHDVLNVFRTTGKIYEHTAGKIYNVPPDQIGPKSEERFIGKVATLALGYQGGHRAFQQMARVYGKEVEDDRAKQIVAEFRESNKQIVSFWYKLNEAALHATHANGKVYEAGPVAFMRKGQFLIMRLPSGRKIYYFRPKLVPGKYGQTTVRYLGRSTQTKKFCEQDLYGGKLADHVTQGTCRDVMAEAMLRLDRAGFKIILTVHDEILCEVKDEDIEVGKLHQIKELMKQPPEWAKDLPIDVDGYAARRYRK